MNINKYVKLLRSFTLTHTIIILILLCGIGDFGFKNTIFITLSILFVHAVAQLSNMIHDRNLDTVNVHKSNRPTVTGEIVTKRAVFATILGIALALFFAYVVSTSFLMRSLILLAVSLAFSLSFILRKNEYSHAIMMAICRGLLPPLVVLGASQIGASISALMFVWALSLNPSKDLKDVEADFAYGIKTIAMKGKDHLKKWMYVWLAMFYVTLVFLVGIRYLPLESLILLVVSPFVFTIPQTIHYPPLVSDNVMAYDNYWFFYTINILLLYVSLTF